MRVVRYHYLPLFLGLTALLCTLEWWIITSAWFPLNPHVLSFAITIDLALGIPFLYYLCLVRTHRSPAITLAPVFLVSVGLANLLLPTAQHGYLDRIEYLLPLIELAVLLFVVFKACAVVHIYRLVRPHAVYVSDALEISLRRVVGTSPVIKLLVTELTLPAYVLIGWFKSYTPSDPQHVPFSYDRKTGYGTVVPLFIGLVSLETMLVHVLVQYWSPMIAWILTGLSVYSLVWIVGDYQACRFHPLVLTADQLHIRTGLRWRADVPLTAIKSVQRATRAEPKASDYVNVAVYGEPRYLLYLTKPIIMHGLLGIEKQVTKIGFSVDDGLRFEAELQRKLQSERPTVH